MLYYLFINFNYLELYMISMCAESSSETKITSLDMFYFWILNPRAHIICYAMRTPSCEKQDHIEQAY